MKMYANSLPNDLPQIELPLTQSAEVSRAKTLAMRVLELAMQSSREQRVLPYVS